MSELRATDRFSINSQLEHLQSKHVGTGHADVTKHEWAVNQHRDSFACYVGRPSMLHYFAVAEGESYGRARYACMHRMIQPCGPAPHPPADE
jgi:splicing factor 3B subunit 5